MEYLDYYDENDNYLGFETREVVHRDGLWHKTVHNWLYTEDGRIVFQIRKDSGKFYTTSSGHVDKGETVEQAFKRETKEEVGLDMDASEAKLVAIVPWKMDKCKKDGTIMKDRAKASVFIAPYKGDYMDFSFDENEVLGVVFVDARDTLKMFEDGRGEVDATLVQSVDNRPVVTEKKVTSEDFLVMPGETHLGKYGDVLESVISATSN